MHIAVKGGFLALSELQLEGRKKLTITEFLKGIPKSQPSIL
jgi:methionyl-tRNA formyltransferase